MNSWWRLTLSSRISGMLVGVGHSWSRRVLASSSSRLIVLASSPRPRTDDRRLGSDKIASPARRQVLPEDLPPSMQTRIEPRVAGFAGGCFDSGMAKPALARKCLPANGDEYERCEE